VLWAVPVAGYLLVVAPRVLLVGDRPLAAVPVLDVPVRPVAFVRFVVPAVDGVWPALGVAVCAGVAVAGWLGAEEEDEDEDFLSPAQPRTESTITNRKMTGLPRAFSLLSLNTITASYVLHSLLASLAGTYCPKEFHKHCFSIRHLIPA